MKWLPLVPLLAVTSMSFGQTSHCNSEEMPRQDFVIKPIIGKPVCWKDFEHPNQQSLLQTLLPKVKGRKVPGLYVSLDLSASAEFELVFSPDTYDTTQEDVHVYPGVLHVTDYNRDQKPDIIAENGMPDRIGIIQFWKNNGDSLELELQLNGHLAAMEKDSEGNPKYFWMHRSYCCEYSIVYPTRYEFVQKQGKYVIELAEKWVYHMNSYMIIPETFSINIPFVVSADAPLNARKARLRGSVYMENIPEEDASQGLYQDKYFVPAATVPKGATGSILQCETIDGKEWCYIILDKNTKLTESTFEKNWRVTSPSSDIPKVRYLGYMEKSLLVHQ